MSKTFSHLLFNNCKEIHPIKAHEPPYKNVASHQWWDASVSKISIFVLKDR
jgi:hypothetical protein